MSLKVSNGPLHIDPFNDLILLSLVRRFYDETYRLLLNISGIHFHFSVTCCGLDRVQYNRTGRARVDSPKERLGKRQNLLERRNFTGRVASRTVCVRPVIRDFTGTRLFPKHTVAAADWLHTPRAQTWRLVECWRLAHAHKSGVCFRDRLFDNFHKNSSHWSLGLLEMYHSFTTNSTSFITKTNPKYFNHSAIPRQFNRFFISVSLYSFIFGK